MSSADTSAAAPAGIDPAMLATLTPEEQEAFKADTDDVEALRALAAGAADDDGGEEDDDDGNGDADTDPAAAAAAEAAATAAAPAPAPATAAAPAAAAPAPAANDDDSDEFAPPPAPVYVAPMPEKYDERMAAFASDSAKINKQFADGEIDEAKRDAELTRIQSERDELLIAKGQALTAQNHTNQAAAQTWKATVANFMAYAAKEEGVDYRKDPVRAKHLDSFIKVLANDDANEGKSMSWFLKQAHKSVNALMGAPAKAGPSPAPAATPAAPAASTAPADKKAAAVAARKPKVEAAATSLAHVPGGEGAGAVGGEFADIDALDGEAFEAAIAKMSPAQREKFLSGQ